MTGIVVGISAVVILAVAANIAGAIYSWRHGDREWAK